MSMIGMRRSVGLLTVLLLGGACTSDPPPDLRSAESEPATGASVESAGALGLRNAEMPIDQLVTAAQPTQKQLDGLVAAGFQHFISLRPSDEDGAGWEESHAAEAAIDFERLPISGAADLTRENVDALAQLLASTGDEPTVLYCGSSNRVGALLALKAHWVDGASAEEAFALGQRAGMTRLAEPVRELLGLEPGSSP